MPKVAVVKHESYEGVKDAVSRAITLAGGLDDIIKSGQKVLIKVNCMAGTPPERAINVHPSVVKAVVELVKEKGATPWVGDSSAIYGMNLRAFEISGIRKVVEETGAIFCDFETSGAYKVEVKDAKAMKTLYIAKPVLDADVVISVAKLKTHLFVKFTGAIKNFFGVTCGAGKQIIHSSNPSLRDFNQALVDIYSVVKPKFGVIDGIEGLDGWWPLRGKVRKANVILASKDCVALDAVAAKIVGYKPEKVDAIKFASERGLGIANLDDIEIIGELPKVKFKKRYVPFMPRIMLRYMRRMVTPYILEEKCDGCGDCLKNCTPKALDVSGKRIDLENCILCMYCYHACPKDAVKLKITRVGKMWLKILMPEFSG